MVPSPTTPSHAGDARPVCPPDCASAIASTPHHCPQAASAAYQDAVACAERMVGAQTVDLIEMLCRIRSEFLEMPGLCLTEPQARRLWSLDCRTCSMLLAALIDAKLLVRTADGRVIASNCSIRDEATGTAASS
jgi:hypothetical protein